MPEGTPAREETGMFSGEEEYFGHGPTDRNPAGDDRPGGGGNAEGSCACAPADDDFDYMVTPFPEHISKHLLFGSLYLSWIIIGLIVAAVRVSAMAVCGEESGRFALNIAYALLPGILAALITIYSKQTEKTTTVFCGMAREGNREEVVAAYEKLVRRAFSNLGMMGFGLLFMGLFWPTVKDRQIYPTPSHNIVHRAAIRDRTVVTVGKTWEGPSRMRNEEEGPDGAPGKVTTWGWVELPLGKVLRLDQDEALDQQGEKWGNYNGITLPPQEAYDPLPPDPTFDENIDAASPMEKQRIDPLWDAHSPKLKRMQEYQDRPRSSVIKGTSLEELRRERDKTEREERGKWTQNRAAALPGPLRYLYLRTTPAERWRLSQATYTMIVLPLLFMSGAMLWCLGGITWLTWSLGRGLRRGERNIWQRIEVGVHPRLSRSIRDVGKNLWYVAVITGSMYTVIVICLFFARADALTLTISSLFSLVVVTIFIVPQLNMHRLMVRAKYSKMTCLNRKLNEALNHLQEAQDKESIEKATAILELQKALGDCCEWPYDFKSLALVLGSVLIPVLMAVFTLYDHFK